MQQVSSRAYPEIRSPASWSKVPLQDLQMKILSPFPTFGPSHFYWFLHRSGKRRHISVHMLYFFSKIRILLGHDLCLRDICFSFLHPIVLYKSPPAGHLSVPHLHTTLTHPHLKNNFPENLMCLGFLFHFANSFSQSKASRPPRSTQSTIRPWRWSRSKDNPYKGESHFQSPFYIFQVFADIALYMHKHAYTCKHTYTHVAAQRAKMGGKKKKEAQAGKEKMSPLYPQTASSKSIPKYDRLNILLPLHSTRNTFHKNEGAVNYTNMMLTSQETRR